MISTFILEWLDSGTWLYKGKYPWQKGEMQGDIRERGEKMLPSET